MLVLDLNTRSFQIHLAGAITTTELTYTVHYRSIALNGTETYASAMGLTNGATAVTPVAAPTAGYKIIIDSVSVYNTDTASATVTARILDDGTARIIKRVTLLTLENLGYETGSGWQVLTSTGALK